MQGMAVFFFSSDFSDLLIKSEQKLKNVFSMPWQWATPRHWQWTRGNYRFGNYYRLEHFTLLLLQLRWYFSTDVQKVKFLKRKMLAQQKLLLTKDAQHDKLCNISRNEHNWSNNKVKRNINKPKQYKEKHLNL